MSKIPITIITNDAPIEIIEHVISPTLIGGKNEIIELELNDPLVVHYDFNDLEAPYKNVHSDAGLYDGTSTGTEKTYLFDNKGNTELVCSISPKAPYLITQTVFSFLIPPKSSGVKSSISFSGTFIIFKISLSSSCVDQ